jgi:pimeloyl-ACP methyl ester carboxylesterase
MSIETRYALNGDATIAYQVLGGADLDLLYVPGWFFNPEIFRDVAPLRRYSERLQSFARVISVEKRGFGMSDRIADGATVSTAERLADISAVADAEGLRRTALMGTFEGGALLLLWAAQNPERVSQIVLIDSFAKLVWRSRFSGGWPLTTAPPRPLGCGRYSNETAPTTFALTCRCPRSRRTNSAAASASKRTRV